MALQYWRNRVTGSMKTSLKPQDQSVWEMLIKAPNGSFTVQGKPKDLEGILKARARNHARDVEMDDNIAFNKNQGRDAQIHANLLNDKGLRRTKLDDL